MKVNIALLGCGTVGSGFLELFQRQRPYISEQFNCECNIVGILVREPNHYTQHPYAHLIKTDFNDILDAKPDLVIEVMGGIEPAKAYISSAISQGCHIITANKDLIAAHGATLFGLAKQHQVTIGFDASVGGGIPILKPIKNALRFSGIDRIEGIVNGTCNYILSRMTEDQLSYSEALEEAMACGFAESNPHSDVSGMDSARKLCVLSSLAYSKCITPENVKTVGITTLDKANIQLASANEMKVKLVARAIKDQNAIFTAVTPCIVSQKHAFYNIDQEYNSIQLYSSDFDTLQFSGKGAGKMPTGTAIFSDLIDFLNGNVDQAAVYPSETNFISLAHSPLKENWVLQMTVNPTSEELGRILQSFSDHRLSIQQHPEIPGIQLEIEQMLEVDLFERLSLVKEWCPSVILMPFLKLS